MSIVRQSTVGLEAIWLARGAPARAIEFHELDTDRDTFTPATTRFPELHAEWYGEWSQWREDEATGISRPRHALDDQAAVRTRLPDGLGLTCDSAGYFVDSGIGWRF